MKRYSLPLLLILFACTYAASSYSATNYPQQQPSPAQQGQPQSCKRQLAEDVPAVTFATARRFFLGRKLKVRAAGSINRAGDFAGSIMAFGAPGRWIYVTNAELRYDPTRKLVGYSRLDGFLNDGSPYTSTRRANSPTPSAPLTTGLR